MGEKAKSSGAPYGFWGAKPLECGSSLPLLNAARCAQFSKVILKTAASCRTPKAGLLSAGKHHCENSTIHGFSPVVMFATMPQTLADCQPPALELHQMA
jgi:hypothetical protein